MNHGGTFNSLIDNSLNVDGDFHSYDCCNNHSNVLNKDALRLLSLNVCGIKTMSKYPELRDLLDNYDIVCLTETNPDDIDVIEWNDVTFKYKNRETISSHRSCGIALGYRNYLENFITPIDIDCPYVLWFSIKKEMFNLSQNVIFSIIYIPPENTRYTSDDAISEIQI